MSRTAYAYFKDGSCTDEESKLSIDFTSTPRRTSPSLGVSLPFCRSLQLDCTMDNCEQEYCKKFSEVISAESSHNERNVITKSSTWEGSRFLEEQCIITETNEKNPKSGEFEYYQQVSEQNSIDEKLLKAIFDQISSGGPFDLMLDCNNNCEYGSTMNAKLGAEKIIMVSLPEGTLAVNDRTHYHSFDMNDSKATSATGDLSTELSSEGDVNPTNIEISLQKDRVTVNDCFNTRISYIRKSPSELKENFSYSTNQSIDPIPNLNISKLTAETEALDVRSLADINLELVTQNGKYVSQLNGTILRIKKLNELVSVSRKYQNKSTRLDEMIKNFEVGLNDLIKMVFTLSKKVKRRTKRLQGTYKLPHDTRKSMVS